jgi:lipoprotein-anchoring transpeptidase ErfK/SrfK
MAELSSALPLIGNDLAPVFRKKQPKEESPLGLYLTAPEQSVETTTPQPRPVAVTPPPLLDIGMVQTVAISPAEHRRMPRILVTFAVVAVALLVAASGAMMAYKLTSTLHTSAATAPAVVRANSMIVSSSNLRSALTKVEGQSISFNGGGTVIGASPADITKWLTVTPNLTEHTTTIGLNTSNIATYLSTVATQVTKQPVNEIVVTHPDGSTATLVQGIDGFSVGSTAQAYNQITNNLLGGGGMNINLPGTVVPFSLSTSTAIYPKLIEVNVNTKKMYVYQNGQLINTFLVSAGAPDHPTPLGTFHIWDKLTSQTMVGPGYVQPNVPWVNYFDHSGDAIHGNYWRPAADFGTVNTSHGCVGVQVSQAEWIYNWAPIGTTVIIHD